MFLGEGAGNPLFCISFATARTTIVVSNRFYELHRSRRKLVPLKMLQLKKYLENFVGGHFFLPDRKISETAKTAEKKTEIHLVGDCFPLAVQSPVAT